VAALPPPATFPDGAPTLFLGCVARAYEAPARAALRRLLAAAGLGLVEPPDQTCCGAAAAHAGDTSEAARLAGRNVEAFRGRETVLCLASGCQPTLADALTGAAKVEDPLVFLARHADRLRFRDAAGYRVALHRPCSQFALSGSIAAMRRLLARIPSLDVFELPDRGCCGAAGLHMLQFPDRARALAEPVQADFAQSGAVELLSANVGCRLHLADGKLVPVRHPLELMAEFLA
jgi:glycolate oxidase iron-sulfur subunit